MTEFIIKLGKLDKKLIWTFVYALSLILIYFVNGIFLVNKHHAGLSQIGHSIGQIAIILIPVIFCYKNENKTENKCTKKNAKYFSYLILLGLLLNVMIGINAFLLNGPMNLHESKFCSKEGAEIIFITLITLFFLKYNYFIHHIISIIIFCLIGVFIDSLINNWSQEFENKKFYHIIMYFAIILVEIVNYCYQKYMMDNLYYQYWNISLANGLSLFVQTGIYFVIELIIKKGESFNNLSILMFYLEILEFNFCKLNENTKRSISQRAKIEELDNNCERFSINNSQIDVGAGYILNQTVTGSIKTEMSILDKSDGFGNSLSQTKISESVLN